MIEESPFGDVILFEIQNCKSAARFPCRLVVRLCGIDFIVEVAEMFFLSIDRNDGAEFVSAFVVENAFVFGCGAVEAAAVVQSVFGGGGRP